VSQACSLTLDLILHYTLTAIERESTWIHGSSRTGHLRHTRTHNMRLYNSIPLREYKCHPGEYHSKTTSLFVENKISIRFHSFTLNSHNINRKATTSPKQLRLILLFDQISHLYIGSNPFASDRALAKLIARSLIHCHLYFRGIHPRGHPT
jgi:hypothetical protein